MQGKSAPRRSKHDAEALRLAGKLLHDEIGPLLSAAGLKLQLLSMDFPETIEHVREVTGTLDEAIDRVRELSRKLSPAPDYARAPVKNRSRS